MLPRQKFRWGPTNLMIAATWIHHLTSLPSWRRAESKKRARHMARMSDARAASDCVMWPKGKGAFEGGRAVGPSFLPARGFLVKPRKYELLNSYSTQ